VIKSAEKEANVKDDHIVYDYCTTRVKEYLTLDDVLSASERHRDIVIFSMQILLASMREK
jgi:hypothetical protein